MSQPDHDLHVEEHTAGALPDSFSFVLLLIVLLVVILA